MGNGGSNRTGTELVRVPNGYLSGVSVPIVLGSASDAKHGLSTVRELLGHVEINSRVSVISAHRNPDVLRDFCEHVCQEQDDVDAIIAVAGMSAALPGDLMAHLMSLGCLTVPVIGVAMPSPEFPSALDALLAMTRLPPGMPVVCAGVGSAGMKNAAIAAIIIAAGASNGSEEAERLREYLLKHHKDPVFDFEPPAQTKG